MSKTAITRRALISAVEEGIRVAGYTGIDADRLREVANTTSAILVGAPGLGEVGCPLVQAGIWSEALKNKNKDSIPRRQLFKFWVYFDRILYLKGCSPLIPIKVVD